MIDLRNDNTSAITYSLLTTLKVPVTRTFLTKKLRSHPYYPSLASVSDILKSYKVENSALRITVDELFNLKTPFIVHLNYRRGSFAIVNKMTQNEVRITLDEKKTKVLTMADFIQSWDNVILTTEADENSCEPDFKQNRKNELLNLIKLPFLIITIAFILFITLLLNKPSINNLPLFFTKATGLFFIWLLIKHELGDQSDLTDKLCTMTKSAGCNEVLNSKASSLFGLVKLADIGFVWFASSFIFLLINSLKVIQISDLNILGWFAVGTLPFIVFSISYQAFIVKKYCPLCLGVMSVLILEAVLFLTFYHFAFELPTVLSVITLTSVVSFVIFTWTVIKPYLMNIEKLFNIENQYLHLKRNPSVINSILSEGADYNVSAILNPIRITEHKTGIAITEVINLYCSPCRDSFRKLEQMTIDTNGQNPTVQFALLSHTESIDNLMTKTAMHMIALSEENTPTQMKQALSDWFELLDYEKWSFKYPIEISETHFYTLKNHRKWFIENKIEGTPATFINTKKLSHKIEIEDLLYMI